MKHTGDDSYLSKVIGVVKEAQETKSKTQNLADKAAGWLFYVALGAGIITLVVWLSLGKNFEYALERMVTLMILSCNHYLGLASLLVVDIPTAVDAQMGVLIYNRNAFENARKITPCIFDKKCTRTNGALAIISVESTSNEY